MEHVSKINGKTYEIGSIMGYGGNGDYDIVVILDWDVDDAPVKIVGFYFGKYDYDATEYYIENEGINIS